MHIYMTGKAKKKFLFLSKLNRQIVFCYLVEERQVVPDRTDFIHKSFPEILGLTRGNVLDHDYSLSIIHHTLHHKQEVNTQTTELRGQRHKQQHPTVAVSNLAFQSKRQYFN